MFLFSFGLIWLVCGYLFVVGLCWCGFGVLLIDIVLFVVAVCGWAVC